MVIKAAKPKKHNPNKVRKEKYQKIPGYNELTILNESGRKMDRKHLSGKAGIYVIINKLTNRFYIGQSKDLYRRWGDYDRLFSGQHRRTPNRVLLKDVKNYKKGDFVFKLLEVIPKSEIKDKRYLLDVEDMWLHSTDINVYNVKPRENLNFSEEVEAKRKLGLVKLIGKNKTVWKFD